jgi:hypothetical protein
LFVNVKKREEEYKELIRETDMPIEMQKYAILITQKALFSKKGKSEVAHMIKEEFDIKYGGDW